MEEQKNAKFEAGKLGVWRRGAGQNWWDTVHAWARDCKGGKEKATWMDAETPDNARDCKDDGHLHVAVQEQCIMHDWTDYPPCEEQRHVMAGGITNQKDVPFMLGTRDAQCCLLQSWSKRPHCLSARCRVATWWRCVHSFQESLVGGIDDFFRHSCLSCRNIEVVDDISRGRILSLFGCSRKFHTNDVVRALVQFSRTGIQDTLH